MLRYVLLSFLLIAFLPKSVLAQASDSSRYDEVRGLINFYQYMLNTVGDAKTPARDKEVIITDSYQKIFQNNHVQIEDDLSSDRSAIVNKDVSAYLRDVDFFFQKVKFTFDGIKVTSGDRPDGTTYYTAQFIEQIDGVSIDASPYKTAINRFVEINLDESNYDLKIVSVYTTKVSRDKELRNWWESLSYEWTKIFKAYVPFNEINKATLEKIAAIDSLNLSGNQLISDITPLIALKDLRYLNLNDTRVSDLSPLRYAAFLKQLNVANTQVQDISILQYFEGLRKLNVSNNRVSDIKSIEKLQLLEDLNLSGTQVYQFSIIKGLTELKSLNLSQTNFGDMTQLSGLSKLQQLVISRSGVINLNGIRGCSSLISLDISETAVKDLAPVSALKQLEEIRINQTSVSELIPLSGLTKLKRVYADYSGVTEASAGAFMKKNPKAIVFINSEKILDWWNVLEANWKELLSKKMGTKKPSREQLIKLLNTDSLDLSNELLVNSAPLKKFKRLSYLNVSKNLFSDLSFTVEIAELQVLVAQRLPITNCAGLELNKQLLQLDLSESQVSDISHLSSLSKLQLVNLDQTNVSESGILEMIQNNPGSIVIYQTDALMSWWEDLSGNWKQAFGLKKIDAFSLHQLTQSAKVSVNNLPVTSLEALQKFRVLRELELSNTGIASLAELSNHISIEKLTCKNGPLIDLKGVEHLYQLKSIDISNTAVKDLKPLFQLDALTEINCSGTNLKRLSGLSQLKNLQILNISNTRVWQLERLYDIRSLKSLVCYNTRIRDTKIAEFKSQIPECEVTYY